MLIFYLSMMFSFKTVKITRMVRITRTIKTVKITRMARTTRTVKIAKTVRVTRMARAARMVKMDRVVPAIIPADRKVHSRLPEPMDK